MKNFTFELDSDGIALVTFDSPGKSMNVISADVMDDFVELTEKIKSDDAVKDVVLTSGKSAFCAGADLSELGGSSEELAKLPEDEMKAKLFEQCYRLNKTLRELETCGKPIAAAINGLALGGGFEITMACHYRVMPTDNSKAKLGLPEAMVGVLPGGGGTQRLPRLVGVMNAAPILLQGKQHDGPSAQALGIVHATVPSEELVSKAKELVKEDPMNATQPWDADKFKFPGGGPYHPAGAQVFGAASPMLRKNTYGNYPAQRYILSCVYEGAQVSIDQGLRIESRYFTKLLLRPSAEISGAVSGAVLMAQLQTFCTKWYKARQQRAERQAAACRTAKRPHPGGCGPNAPRQNKCPALEPQHPLCDDVFLDFVGAAIDRLRPRGEIGGDRWRRIGSDRVSRPVRRRGIRRSHHRGAAAGFQHQLGDRLMGFGRQDLHDGRFIPRRPAIGHR